MTIKVGINGFGRMGRLALRRAFKHPDFEFAVINEPYATAETMECPEVGLRVPIRHHGPLPFIPINPSAKMILVSMSVVGFSVGLVYVSSFKRAEIAATRNGFPEDTKTYHLISSMWVSFDFMGGFFGASVSGIVVDIWGFRTATVMCWNGYLIMMAIDIIEFHYLKHDNASFNRTKYTEIKTHE